MLHFYIMTRPSYKHLSVIWMSVDLFGMYFDSLKMQTVADLEWFKADPCS